MAACSTFTPERRPACTAAATSPSFAQQHRDVQEAIIDLRRLIANANASSVSAAPALPASESFVRSTLECGGKATALGGRWKRDDSQRVMLAPSAGSVTPPPSQSGGSVATALQSFAKCAASRASIFRILRMEVLRRPLGSWPVRITMPPRFTARWDEPGSCAAGAPNLVRSGRKQR